MSPVSAVQPATQPVAPIHVHKFGGTSVQDASRIRTIAARLREAPPQERPIVVVSALSGITETLLGLVLRVAPEGPDAIRASCATLRRRHLDAATALSATEADTADIEALLADLEATALAAGQLRDTGWRVRDRIVAFGEKLSARLTAIALRTDGLNAVAADADTFLPTDDQFGQANPVPGMAARAVARALQPLLDAGQVPVVTGFIGRAPDGSTTTLGRGGSDFSATFVGGALQASCVTIWTDIDGVYTCDPRQVPSARSLPQLNYGEAAELSYFGAKVLHPRSIQPVASLGIPVWVRDSFRPHLAGTIVDGRMTPGSHPVKALTAIGGHALVTVEGRGMAGVPGVSARLFGALADAQISVTMISQSSSESSICVAVPEAQADAAEIALKRAFRLDLSHGDVEEIAVRRSVHLVACVGLGMAHSPGVAGRVCSALGRGGINVLAIAQGSSERNITLAVESRSAGAALRALHDAFGLHRLDTGHETEGGIDVMVLGLGSISRALVPLLQQRIASIRTRFGTIVRIVALADSTGALLAPTGLSDARIAEVFAHKATRQTVAQLPLAAGEHRFAGTTAEQVKAMLEWRFADPVLVDLTAARDMHSVWMTALQHGADIVTANKWPLAGPNAAWDELQDTADTVRRRLCAEATVGAGLPVIDTIDMLSATGDNVQAVEGCLSGTLSYVLSQMEDGVAFSEAVREAARRGYTEPDPVLDLVGLDVARKAIIIGRIAGFATDPAQVEREGLVPDELVGLSPEALPAALAAHDARMAQLLAEARAVGGVLRYTAHVSPTRVWVGPRVVLPGDPMAGLVGTDNRIVVWSDRYADRPLSVTGPGAGVDVTAMGVLADILRLIAERSDA